ARYAPIVHDHDTDYYTKAEVDALIDAVAVSTHDHDDRYYTETEMDGMVASMTASINGKSTIGHAHDDRYHTKEHAVTIFAPIIHAHDAASVTGGTLSDARIPNLNASKITAGVLSSARIP